MEGDYGLTQIPVALKMPEESHSSQAGSIDRDAADLARLGKKPVLKVSSELLLEPLILALTMPLKRRFGFMSLLGFSCTILITWEGMVM